MNLCRALLLLSSVFLPSCGPGTNLNQLFVDGEDKERLDSLYAEAEAAFDDKDFSLAESKIEKLVTLDPSNQDYARLKAWIYFGKVDLIPTTILKKMYLVGEKKKSSGQTTSTDANGAMQDLAEIINLTEADFEKLGEKKESTNPIFKDLPVIYPYKLSDADNNPREKVELIKNLDAAMKAVCGFVDSSILAEDEFRYGTTASTKCPSNTKGTATAETAALFAFGHILEAVAYQKVLLYKTGSGTSTTVEVGNNTNNPLSTTVTNLSARADEIKKIGRPSVDQVSDFIAANVEMADDFDKVYDVSEGSLLQATLKGLRIGVASFKKVPGLPASVTESLEKGLNALEEQANKLPGGSSANQVSQLKEQMNKQVETKLDQAISAAQLNNTQIADLCQKLGGSTFSPTACK